MADCCFDLIRSNVALVVFQYFGQYSFGKSNIDMFLKKFGKTVDPVESTFKFSDVICYLFRYQADHLIQVVIHLHSEVL